MFGETGAGRRTNRSTRDHGGRPNIVLVVADDHAAHAIGAHGSGVN
jgi:hypothetical protein